MLAIADAAGEDWPEKARNALTELLTGAAAEDDSPGVRLLADIRSIYQENETQKKYSAHLVESLNAIEGAPWAEWNHGKPMTANSLARLLKRYDITPRTVRIGSDSAKGYHFDDFSDAFARYLTPQPSQPSQDSIHAAGTQLSQSSQVLNVTNGKPAETPMSMRVVTPVTVVDEQEQRRCYIHGVRTDWWERPPAGSGYFVCERCHPQPT